MPLNRSFPGVSVRIVFYVVKKDATAHRVVKCLKPQIISFTSVSPTVTVFVERSTPSVETVLSSNRSSTNRFIRLVLTPVPDLPRRTTLTLRSSQFCVDIFHSFIHKNEERKKQPTAKRGFGVAKTHYSNCLFEKISRQHFLSSFFPAIFHSQQKTRRMHALLMFMSLKLCVYSTDDTFVFCSSVFVFNCFCWGFQ